MSWWVNTVPITAAVVFIGLAAVLGACCGSFICCWAYRFSIGETIPTGRSHCLSCGRELTALDLIPIISWLAFRGKCRKCGSPIGVRCLICELLGAVIFALLIAMLGPVVETAEMIVLCCVLLFVTLTDLDTRIIPNSALLVGLTARLLYLIWAFVAGQANTETIIFYTGSAIATGIFIFLIVLIMDHVLQKPSMGGGDMKLLIVAAFFFGWQQTLFVIVVACIIGLVAVFVTQKKRGEAFPFGPAISAAMVIAIFVGEPFSLWYSGLLGL